MAGQVWSISADGGYMYTDQLSDYLRMELLPTVRYRQFCDADDHSDKGLSAGDAFYWNVYSKVVTGGGALSEDQAMPETKFTISQASGTVTEYGNSVPYTKKLDDLSLHPVKDIINKVLKIDATEALDGAAYVQFDATPLIASDTNTSVITLSTTGTATDINNIALNKAHIKGIVDEMKERNIPQYFDNGDYGCIARTKTYRTFKNELETVHQYVPPGFDMILNGEIGRYEGVRFFEQTNRAANTTDWATNSKSDDAHFFGGDTVHEAIAIMEEIRGKIPGDFGRDKGVAWYALLGYKLVHSVAAQARIVKWGSTV